MLSSRKVGMVFNRFLAALSRWGNGMYKRNNKIIKSEFFHMDEKHQSEMEEFFDRVTYSRQSFEDEGLTLSEQITITALTAAGKTETINLLKKSLPGFTFVSGGDFMRDHLADYEVSSIEALAELGRENPVIGIDRRCDEYLFEMAFSHPHSVLQGRFVQCIAPSAFHVFLTCPLEIRAARRFANEIQNPERKTQDVILEEIRKRDEDDCIRFEGLYPDSMWPESHYDLVVSTESNSPKEVVNKILLGYHEWHQRIRVTRVSRQPALVA